MIKAAKAILKGGRGSLFCFMGCMDPIHLESNID